MWCSRLRREFSDCAWACSLYLSMRSYSCWLTVARAALRAVSVSFRRAAEVLQNSSLRRFSSHSSIGGLIHVSDDYPVQTILEILLGPDRLVQRIIETHAWGLPPTGTPSTHSSIASGISR